MTAGQPALCPLCTHFVNGSYSKNFNTPFGLSLREAALQLSCNARRGNLDFIVILKNKLEYMHKGNSFVHGTLSLYL